MHGLPIYAIKFNTRTKNHAGGYKAMPRNAPHLQTPLHYLVTIYSKKANRLSQKNTEKNRINPTGLK